MRKSLPLLAAAALGLAAIAQPASAQDLTTATFGGTTIWAGGGVQFLTLPDMKFTGRLDGNGNFRRQKNLEGDWLDAGPAAAGGIETALGFWGNARVTGTLKGFWAGVETDDHTSCRGPVCVVIDPTGAVTISGPPVLKTKADREADYWGGQFELKFARAEAVEVRPNLYRNDYFIVGADVRGIDQDTKLRGHFAGDPIYTYKETLDTTYYGAYIGLGGEYAIPLISGIGSGLGLRTFISGRAGLYAAETDYDGSFTSFVRPFDSTLELTRDTKDADELAFIGSISLETRKQIGPRSSLSLWTDYEFISSVPKMNYINANHATRIEDEAIFASRTMIRLNIGLGPTQLYEEPLR
ncbi:MAG TPA: hypothetical protein VNO69_12120 [Methyloceanibacter sp.]|jgi:hypothetical protein|nr:hypothetical protein [Methyloceanibacter sp.]